MLRVEQLSYMLCCSRNNLAVHMWVISDAYVYHLQCSVNPFVLTCTYTVYAGVSLLGQFHPYCPSTFLHSYRVRIVPSVDVFLLQLFMDDWNLCCGCILCAVVLIIV
jgi:hypothetical protein